MMKLEAFKLSYPVLHPISGEIARRRLPTANTQAKPSTLKIGKCIFRCRLAGIIWVLADTRSIDG